MRSTNEFQSMVMDESDSNSKMDKKQGDGKLKLLLLLLLAATVFIITVMVFVIFCYQQRKFAELEMSMRSQKNFEMNAGSELEKNMAKLKNLVSSLNLTFSTSITNNQLNNGAQTKTLSDLQTLINNLGSSLGSLSTKLEPKLQDLDSQKNTLSEIKASVLSLTSSINSLSSKLQNSVRNLLSALSDLTTKHENGNKTVPVCKSRWIPFQSKCYFFSKDLMNWNEARNSCRSDNGMLVKIETEEELEFLTLDRSLYWVGLTDETTAEWRWDDGSPFVRNGHWWHEGQPDNWDGHGLGGGEDCGHLTIDGKLNDNHCSGQMRYICQI